MRRFIKQGPVILAIAIVALGIENVVCARLSVFDKDIVFAGHTVVAVIPWPPAQAWLSYLVGLIMIASGLAVLFGFRPRLMAMVLGSLFLVSALTRILFALVDRTACFEMLAISGASYMLAGIEPGEEPHIGTWNPALEGLIKSGRFLFAASSIVFGIDHFQFLTFIASLIPGWIPFHLFWVAFTGAGFIAAGLSFATRWLANWAGFFLGVMFLLWFLLLHLPRVLGMAGVAGAPRNPNEWSSALIALALGGASWICAQSISRMEQLR